MKSCHSLSVAACALLLSLTLEAAAAADEVSSDTEPLDIVFAIDASTNALVASGADVDGNGRTATQRFFLGFLPIRPDRADSVLAAELRAVRSGLERLDSLTTRVGAIAYAGDAADAAKRGAEVLAPLTHEYDRVRAALDALAARGPKGMTDLSGGIDLATRELGAASSEDPARPGARRVMILLSDGRATLPHVGDPVTNRSESVAAAQRAARSDIRIIVYGIGPEVFEPVLRAIAEASQGEYARVENAAQIDLVSAQLLSSPDEPGAP